LFSKHFLTCWSILFMKTKLQLQCSTWMKSLIPFYSDLKRNNSSERKASSRKVTSYGRGQNLRGVYAVNVNSFYIPPVLRKVMKGSLSSGAYAGNTLCCQKNGWMNIDVFCVVKTYVRQICLNFLLYQ